MIPMIDILTYLQQNNEWVTPLDDSPEAREAADISTQRTLGWFAMPIC